ncbi:MAG TPA: hypothetical protein VKA89_10915 [Solirubrobacterales bacterium]|nr:hypothetical protein [Solirubrobacterales bacterium]
MRRRLVLAVCAVAVAAAACGGGAEDSGPGVARAPDRLPEGRKPVILEPGPVAIESAQVRDAALDQTVSLGVDTVRMVVFWRETVPGERPVGFDPADPLEPGYDFAKYDGFARAAAERNLKLLVTISGPGPRWASGGAKGVRDPDVGEFGEFATAVATRYGGEFDPDGPGGDDRLPGADMWSVWNEPNLSIFLQPQLRDGAPYSPVLYRELYLAAQDAVTLADPGTPLLVGETAPTGSTDSVDPIPFAEGVLCLSPEARASPACDSGRIAAAGWATHPYGVSGQAPFDPPPSEDFVTIDSLGGLERVLDEGARAGQLKPELPVFITEYGIQSLPDPLLGVPVTAQAAYLSIAELFAYADNRSRSFAQYLLFDDPADRVPGTEYGGFESGLRFDDGAPKPALDAFRLPLVVRRDGDRVQIWGLVRPAREATEVELRVLDGGREHALETVETDGAGIYELESAYRSGRLWKVRWTDAAGTRFEGALTRAYEFEDPARGSG